MNPKSLIVIALAALLVFAGGAAAMPGNAPDDAGADAADDHQPDDPGANETDGDANVTDADEVRDENATDAPPTEMPEQVPNHVTQIHDLVREKLDGALTGQALGEAISGLVGGGDDSANSQADAAGEPAENANGQSETAQSDAGPSGDLPEPVPDHVAQIHELITSWLDGDGDGSLGEQVSGIAG